MKNEIQYEDLETLLYDFADWLHKKGYIDTDYYTEEPTAIDAYLKDNNLTNKNLSDKL